MEDRHQTKDLLRAEIFEIEIRDQFARQIALPLNSQDLSFQINQTATIEPEVPQAARAEQQIQMGQYTEGRALADHPIARFQQRLIEGPAVVGDQHFELFQMLVERAQLAGLFREIAHEELPDAETVLRDTSHADQKRIGAGTSRQAGCFGIQETPFGYRYIRDLAV